MKGTINIQSEGLEPSVNKGYNYNRWTKTAQMTTVSNQDFYLWLKMKNAFAGKLIKNITKLESALDEYMLNQIDTVWSFGRFCQAKLWTLS